MKKRKIVRLCEKSKKLICWLVEYMDGLQIFSIVIGTSGVVGSFIVLSTHIINKR